MTVNGTVGVDVMAVSGSAGFGDHRPSRHVVIAITNAEPANDTLTINTSAGDDLVSASGLPTTASS